MMGEKRKDVFGGLVNDCHSEYFCKYLGGTTFASLTFRIFEEWKSEPVSPLMDFLQLRREFIEELAYSVLSSGLKGLHQVELEQAVLQLPDRSRVHLLQTTEQLGVQVAPVIAKTLGWAGRKKRENNWELAGFFT